MAEPMKIYRRSELEAISRRFWSKVKRLRGRDACWVWTGANNGRKNYGKFALAGRSVYAHRASWFLWSRRWPKRCVLHHCDNPRCVRPTHLFQGSVADNNADMAKKGRVVNYNTGKTICKNGHPLNDDNVRLVKGGRRCWPCFLEWQRKYRRREVAA